MKEQNFRKRIRLLIGLIAVFALGTGAFALYAAAEGTAGTSSDPVVTKSYVDRVVSELKQQGTGDPSQGGNGGQSSSGGSGMQIIELKQGQTLIGYQNTQIIVRSGIVHAAIPGENGISDLTEGADLREGDPAQKDHLLLVPRSDGRGIKADTDAFVMVQGDYAVDW